MIHERGHCKECGDTYAVAVGSAFDGISLYGPFGDYDEALEFAEADGHTGDDWHVVPLIGRVKDAQRI